MRGKYSESDLRSTNLQGKYLDDRDFRNTRVGLSPSRCAGTVLLSLAFAAIFFGLGAAFAGSIGFGTPRYNNPENIKMYQESRNRVRPTQQVELKSALGLAFIVASTLIYITYSKGWLNALVVVIIVFGIPSAPAFVLKGGSYLPDVMDQAASLFLLVTWVAIGTMVCGLIGAVTAFVIVVAYGLVGSRCYWTSLLFFVCYRWSGAA